MKYKPFSRKVQNLPGLDRMEPAGAERRIDEAERLLSGLVGGSGRFWNYVVSHGPNLLVRFSSVPGHGDGGKLRYVCFQGVEHLNIGTVWDITAPPRITCYWSEDNIGWNLKISFSGAEICATEVFEVPEDQIAKSFR